MLILSKHFELPTFGSMDKSLNQLNHFCLKMLGLKNGGQLLQTKLVKFYCKFC